MPRSQPSGRGHTDHHLIAVVTGFGRPVVFWGDLVVEDAVLVPGHGAVVDAALVRGHQAWLRQHL